MSALNYNRMPGPGDLPGDSTNPNSPDYVEPEYGEDDAEGEVAAQMIEADEVAELVSDVRCAAGLLDWIARNVDVPAAHLAGFRNLDRKARQISRAVDACVEANQ